MDNLVAILLVVRSRPGPKIVHCYPSNAQRLTRQQRSHRDQEDADSDSDIDVNGIASLQRSHKGEPSQENAPAAPKPEDGPPDTENVLGLSQDSLARLLAPGTSSDRKKFEMCLDGLTFIGHPIHALEDSRWTRKEVPGPDRFDHAASEASDLYGDYTNFGINVTGPASPVRIGRDFKHIQESFESQLGRSLGTTSMNSASSGSSSGAEQLSMFNIVFALDTAGRDSSQRCISDAYTHIIKKLSKALHYCQKQSSYVGVETRRLQAIYARAKQDQLALSTLQQQILESSELAWAMKEVYDSISAEKIAGIRLNGQAISLQMPFEDDEGTGMEPHAGLLLLEDKGALLRELSHPEASPLAHFIREHTPTKSLQKLATRLDMSTQEVLYLARHLVKWRKARPIAPLHPRNTYIVQSDAPTERLADFTTEYARKFPGLPSLPQMLKFLSSRPVKYGLLIPSRDHRAPYTDILAYLVRHKFVTQLKTYGWFRRVPQRGTNIIQAEKVDRNRTPLSVASLLSPQLRAVDNDAASVSSDRTAIPLSNAENDRKSPVTEGATLTTFDQDARDPWDVISKPLEPSVEDTRFLANVRQAIGDDELSGHFDALRKYFTGDEALESIAGREGLKRSQVERWLEVLQKEGLITIVRHA